MGQQRFCARAIDAEAADGGGAAHHPQLLVAPEEPQVRHEPVAKRLRAHTAAPSSSAALQTNLMPQHCEAGADEGLLLLACPANV